MNNRFVTKARGVLVSQMMQKNLLLCQEEAAKSAAVTLMSTDVEGIASALPSIHEAWASVVELSVGVYLLSTIVKEASFLVMLPAISMYYWSLHFFVLENVSNFIYSLFRHIGATWASLASGNAQLE